MPEPISSDEFHYESVLSPPKRRERRKVVLVGLYGLLADIDASADELGIPQKCVTVGDETVATEV